MWRLLVTLQSYPSSAGRFYLVSLISIIVAHAGSLTAVRQGTCDPRDVNSVRYRCANVQYFFGGM